MINNIFVNGINKDAIEFFIKNIGSLEEVLPIGQDDLLQQINSATISVENTLYYHILKFYHNGYSSDTYDKTIEMQVVKDDISPLVFHMYFNKKMLCEFEFFNADSSLILEENLFGGNVLIHVY